MFPETKSRGNIDIRGKQNSLFPSGPVINDLLYSKTNGSKCGKQIITLLAKEVQQQSTFGR